MAISSGDWSSGTDPFVLAESLSFSGFSTTHDPGNNRMYVDFTCKGALNAPPTRGLVVSDEVGKFREGGAGDPDIQDVYVQKETDPNKQVRGLTCELRTGNGLDYALGGDDFGPWYEDDGGAWNEWNLQDLIGAGSGAGSGAFRIYFNDRTAGANFWRLFLFAAYAWQGRDPAQTIFSMIAHRTGDSALKSYLNQASFQNASDYYDVLPMRLDLIREVGSSVAQQVERIMQCTTDMLGIGPAESGGVVAMHMYNRRALTERTTAIDLDSKDALRWSTLAGDQYQLDRLQLTFGHSYVKRGPNANNPDDHRYEAPLDLPTGQDQLEIRVGASTATRTASYDAPYVMRRRDALLHHDINYFRDHQLPIEVTMGPLGLNYRLGDRVHVTSLQLGLDGTEDFLIHEWEPSMEDGTVRMRLLQLRGLAGKLPVELSAANLRLWLRPNALGKRRDGDAVAGEGKTRDLDRWEDESGNVAHAWAGSYPDMPVLDDDSINGWSAVDFQDIHGLGLGSHGTAARDLDGLSSAAADYTAVFVINPDKTGSPSEPLVLFASPQLAQSGVGTPGKVQFKDGATWRGTQNATTGAQILSFVLKATTSSKIRRNGADIETGLAWTQAAIASPALGDGPSAGDYFDGRIAEVILYNAALSDANLLDLERHLGEKYGITVP